MIPLTSQVYAFLITIGIGVFMGVIFDLYRLVLNHFRWRRWGRDIGDFIFWLIVTGMVFLLLLHGNMGEVRLYVLLGLVIGLSLYFRLLTGRVRAVIKSFVTLITRIVLFLFMVICFPFRLIKKMVLVPLGFIGIGLARLINGMSLISKNYLLNPIRQIYRRLTLLISGKLKNWWLSLKNRRPKE